MNERCDQIIQCQDKSDEYDCSLLVFEESYSKLVPPVSFNKTDDSIIPVSIKVSTSLRNVLEISEFTHTIDLKLGISLQWYDNRLLFHNLKSEEALNVLSNSEVSKIFKPSSKSQLTFKRKRKLASVSSLCLSSKYVQHSLKLLIR